MRLGRSKGMNEHIKEYCEQFIEAQSKPEFALFIMARVSSVRYSGAKKKAAMHIESAIKQSVHAGMIHIFFLRI